MPRQNEGGMGMNKYARLALSLTDRELTYRLLNFETVEWMRRFIGKPETALLYKEAFRVELDRRKGVRN